MKSKEKIIEEMIKSMPYYLPEVDIPYIFEAMEAYASQFNKWIPVTERLPEVNDRYLGCREDGDVYVYKFEDGIFYFMGQVCTNSVRYWMPLPQKSIKTEV